MVYLIGIGPGDPELLTLKAARILLESDIIYVPQSNMEGRSVAEKIIAPHVPAKKIRYAAIAMRPGTPGSSPVYPALAAQIAAAVSAGSKVAYVTLGDTLLYSTAQYLGRELCALGVHHEYVPGIPAFVAAASHGGIALAGGRESLAVSVMPENAQELDTLAAHTDTLVLMKINKRLPLLLEYTRLYHPAEAALFCRLGLDGETFYDLRLQEGLPEAVGYLSIAVIKRGKPRS